LTVPSDTFCALFTTALSIYILKRSSIAVWQLAFTFAS
jgi:hypothetical protein